MILGSRYLDMIIQKQQKKTCYMVMGSSIKMIRCFRGTKEMANLLFDWYFAKTFEEKVQRDILWRHVIEWAFGDNRARIMEDDSSSQFIVHIIVQGRWNQGGQVDNYPSPQNWWQKLFAQRPYCYCWLFWDFEAFRRLWSLNSTASQKNPSIFSDLPPSLKFK